MAPRTITFHPHFGDEALELGKAYRTNDSTAVIIDTWRFYVSNFRWLRDGKTMGQEADSHHLIDVSDSASLSFQLNIPKEADALAFMLGIDSLMSVSGALGGDLDPTKGMYWTWHSGYINFKLEGSSASCPSKDKRFQFHLGGYLPPFYAAREVVLPITDGAMDIVADLSAFLGQVNLRTQRSIMSPSADAVRLSEAAATIFRMDGKE